MSFYDFLFGGLAGMTATSIIQPIDTVKVRIQLIGEAGVKGVSKSPYVIARTMFANDGALSFYKGIDSALFRQATYGTARLGIYKYIFNKRKEEKGEVTTKAKFCISLFAGAIGGLIANPSDLVLVRFQSDSTLPSEQRRNYRNVFHAFFRITKDEGLISLWRGSTVTLGRIISMNVSMLMTYDEIKERLNKKRGSKDAMSTQIFASLISGIFCSAASLPFDNAKTKLQKMTKKPDGTFPYNGVLDVFKKSIKREGVSGLWIGYLTYYLRVGNHAMITLLTQDYLQSHFNPHFKK